jgi:hypothetical protein
VKGSAKPYTIAIPWIYSPAASKLGAAPLKQSRRCGDFISWNNAIVPDILLLPFPTLQIPVSAKLLNALHKCFLTEISNGFTLTVCKRN